MRAPAVPAFFVCALAWTAPGHADPALHDDRVRTVILGVQARRGIEDAKLPEALTDVVQGIYARDAGRIVIGRDDLRRVLELEAEKAAAGCDTNACLAEIGAALDAARIVTGSLDRLGDGFMVTLTEIDARTLEPVGREQERTSGDENALVDAVLRLAERLTTQTNAALKTAGRLVANAGSIEIGTDPRGAQVILAGTSLGTSPTRIDNLATGTQRLRLLRDDYEPIEVDVPVFPGGVTKVDAQMRILRKLAEQNLEIRRAQWRDATAWHTAGGWTKAIGGSAVTAYGGLLIAQTLRGNADGLLMPVVITSAGAGILAWGVVDLLNPIPPPVPEWEIERKVTITPPNGIGEQQVRVIQPGAGVPTR